MWSGKEGKVQFSDMVLTCYENVGRGLCENQRVGRLFEGERLEGVCECCCKNGSV